MRSLCPVSFIHGFLWPIAYSRQDLASTLKRCTHGGHPLEFPLLVKFSHMISLHQSAPLIKSLNPVARSMRAHSSLIRQASQNGEFAPINCAVLRSHCCFVRHVEDIASPPDGPRVLSRLIPSLYSRGTQSLGPNVAVGPPDCPEIGSRGPSPPYGW